MIITDDDDLVITS